MIRKDRAWRIEVCADGRQLDLVTFVEPDGNDPVAYAGLLEDDKPERWQALPLEHLATAFGGLRWWLTCPLSPGGKTCRRRVGKLYLPDIDSGFGCRECHQLAY